MEAVAVESEAPQVTLRVLIAEDSCNVVEALALMLAAAGATQVVGVVANEAEALAWAESHGTAWDLAIVDLILDQGAGFNVIRRLKQHNAAGRIVVFSGFTSDVIRNHCRSLGADLVLGKHQNQELAKYVEKLTAAA